MYISKLLNLRGLIGLMYIYFCSGKRRVQSLLEGVLSPHVFRHPSFFYPGQPPPPPCSYHDSQGCPYHLQSSLLAAKGMRIMSQGSKRPGLEATDVTCHVLLVRIDTWPCLATREIGKHKLAVSQEKKEMVFDDLPTSILQSFLLVANYSISLFFHRPFLFLIGGNPKTYEIIEVAWSSDHQMMDMGSGWGLSWWSVNEKVIHPFSCSRYSRESGTG